VRSGDTTTVKVNGVPIFSNIPQTGLGAGKIGGEKIWDELRMRRLQPFFPCRKR